MLDDKGVCPGATGAYEDDTNVESFVVGRTPSADWPCSVGNPAAPEPLRPDVLAFGLELCDMATERRECVRVMRSAFILKCVVAAER